jgi:hypothetical protein
MARTIETNCFGIVVTLTGEKLPGGTITSELHDTEETGRDADLYNAAVDGLEAMILAQACAGVDITDPKYLEGIENAAQQIAVKF